MDELTSRLNELGKGVAAVTESPLEVAKRLRQERLRDHRPTKLGEFRAKLEPLVGQLRQHTLKLSPELYQAGVQITLTGFPAAQLPAGTDMVCELGSWLVHFHHDSWQRLLKIMVGAEAEECIVYCTSLDREVTPGVSHHLFMAFPSGIPENEWKSEKILR